MASWPLNPVLTRWRAAAIGGVIPLFGWKHDRFMHHPKGGEQTRTLSVTWVRRRWELEYSSPWRKR